MGGLRRGCVGLGLLLLLAGCSNDADYNRRPYSQDGRIDGGLASAEEDMIQSIAAGRTDLILRNMTAPRGQARMKRFLQAYGNHPARAAGDEPVGEDPRLGDQYITVSCALGKTQRVGLAWGWLDAAWRAYPLYHYFPLGRCG